MTRAVAKIDGKQIADMELDITFRMTVSEWHDLMRQTGHGWPSCEIGRYIASVLGHITRATEATFTEPLHAADAIPAGPQITKGISENGVG